MHDIYAYFWADPKEDWRIQAGLSADRLRQVRQPVVALYDEFSPFLATCRWLGENLPDCTAEIIPAAKHLALLENTPGFIDAVRRHLRRLAKPPASGEA